MGFYVPGIWSRTCTRLRAHALALSRPANPASSSSPRTRSCVIRRVPQRCITERRGNRGVTLHPLTNHGTLRRPFAPHMQRDYYPLAPPPLEPNSASPHTGVTIKTRHHGAPLEFRAIAERDISPLVSNNAKHHLPGR